GEDVPPGERDRLRRAHEALVSAGPQSELPPWLEHPPSPWLSERKRSQQRRRRTVLAFALAAAFGVGFLVGNGGGGFTAGETVAMHGTAAAPQAKASLLVGHEDAA